MAFMDAVERHGLDWLKTGMGLRNLPQRKSPKKALEHAGCNFNALWTLNARIAHNPYTDRDMLTVTWLTVAYYLEKKGVITLRNVTEAKERVEEYCRKEGI